MSVRGASMRGTGVRGGALRALKPRGDGPRAGGRARAGGAGARAAEPARAGSLLSTISTRAAMWALLGALCIFGLVMVLSASSIVSLAQDGGPWAIFKRQLLYEGMGLVAMVVAARVDYHRWRLARVVLPAVTIALLIIVRMVGQTVGGSSRWLVLGPLRIQPSELAKLALIIFVAELLARRFDQGCDPSSMVGPVVVVFAVMALLVVMQPDLGTAIVLAAITLGMLYAADVPAIRLVKVAGILVASAVALGLVLPGRRQRIMSFLHPFAHASSSGYQVVQALVGLGNGGLFGLGLGNSRQKWGLLPNAYTDFIFSIIGEELGLIASIVVLAAFVALAWLGLRAASRSPDRFGMFLAVGVTWWLSMQAVINIGAVIGVLPVTGIPLPFISFGGSSLVINMAAAGILVNVAAHERPPGGRARTGAGARPGTRRPPRAETAR